MRERVDRTSIVGCIALLLTLTISCTNETQDYVQNGATETGIIQVRDLVEIQAVTGTVDFGKSWILPITSTGLVTRTLTADQVVDFGEVLVWINEQPVVLLRGTVPAYREMQVGDVGADVEQLELELNRSGHLTASAIDGVFDDVTATAVAHWRQEVGLTEEPTLGPAHVAFSESLVRVVSSYYVGQPFDALEVTGTEASISIILQSDKTEFFALGTEPSILLGSGREIKGQVTAVDRYVDAEGNLTSSWQVEIESDDDLEQGLVTVTGSVVLAEGVLAVPARALVTVSPGGFALQRATGELVPVEVGAIADGWIEIRSDQLQAGDEIIL